MGEKPWHPEPKYWKHDVERVFGSQPTDHANLNPAAGGPAMTDQTTPEPVCRYDREPKSAHFFGHKLQPTDHVFEPTLETVGERWGGYQFCGDTLKEHERHQWGDTAGIRWTCHGFRSYSALNAPAREDSPGRDEGRRLLREVVTFANQRLGVRLVDVDEWARLSEQVGDYLAPPGSVATAPDEAVIRKAVELANGIFESTRTLLGLASVAADARLIAATLRALLPDDKEGTNA